MCACSMSVNSLAEWEKLLSDVRLLVAIASARESDLCVPVAHSAQELKLVPQAHTNHSPLEMQWPQST